MQLSVYRSVSTLWRQGGTASGVHISNFAMRVGGNLNFLWGRAQQCTLTDLCTSHVSLFGSIEFLRSEQQQITILLLISGFLTIRRHEDQSGAKPRCFTARMHASVLSSFSRRKVLSKHWRRFSTPPTGAPFTYDGVRAGAGGVRRRREGQHGRLRHGGALCSVAVLGPSRSTCWLVYRCAMCTRHAEPVHQSSVHFQADEALQSAIEEFHIQVLHRFALHTHRPQPSVQCVVSWVMQALWKLLQWLQRVDSCCLLATDRRALCSPQGVDLTGIIKSATGTDTSQCVPNIC